MTTELVVREHSSPVRTLDELAEIARSEHQLVGAALGDALGHAILVGKALLEAREQLEWGQFGSWLEQTGILENWAYAYMRLAHYEAILPKGIGTKNALDFLKGLPSIRGDSRGRGGYPEDVRVEARRLFKEGKTQAEIARILNVSPATVYKWCSTQAGARKWRALQKRKERRALILAERREAKRREVERAARFKGGSTAKAYSLTRQLAQELDRLIAKSADPEEREALKLALNAAYRVEANVGRALGVDYGRGDAYAPLHGVDR